MRVRQLEIDQPLGGAKNSGQITSVIVLMISPEQGHHGIGAGTVVQREISMIAPTARWIVLRPTSRRVLSGQERIKPRSRRRAVLPVSGLRGDPHHEVDGPLSGTVIESCGAEEIGFTTITLILEKVVFRWSLCIETHFVPPPSVRQLTGGEDIRRLSRNA